MGYRQLGVLCVFGIALAGLGRNCSAEQSPMSTYKLPDGAISAKKGDFIVCEGEEGSWQVVRVERVVLCTPMVALKFSKGLEFLPESTVVDSVSAERPRLAFVLTLFAEVSVSEEEAIRKVRAESLGKQTVGVLREPTYFLPSKCRVIE